MYFGGKIHDADAIVERSNPLTAALPYEAMQCGLLCQCDANFTKSNVNM